MTRPTEEQAKAVKELFAEYLLSRKPRNDGTIRVEMDNFYSNGPQAERMRHVMRDVCGKEALMTDNPSAWARTMAACEFGNGYPVMVGQTMWRVSRAAGRRWKIAKISDVPVYRPRPAHEQGIVTEEMMRSLIASEKQNAKPRGEPRIPAETARRKLSVNVTVDAGYDAIYAVFDSIQRLAESYGYVKPEGEGSEYKIFAWAAAKHVEYLRGVLKGFSADAIERPGYTEIAKVVMGIQGLAEMYGYTGKHSQDAKSIIAWQEGARQLEHLRGVLDKLSLLAAAQLEAFSTALGIEVPDEVE